MSPILENKNDLDSPLCASAMSFDSCNSCHFHVGVSKTTLSQPELTFLVERESLDVAFVLVLRIALL